MNCTLLGAIDDCLNAVHDEEDSMKGWSLGSQEAAAQQIYESSWEMLENTVWMSINRGM